MNESPLDRWVDRHLRELHGRPAARTTFGHGAPSRTVAMRTRTIRTPWGPIAVREDAESGNTQIEQGDDRLHAVVRPDTIQLRLTMEGTRR